jgi:cytochrome P450
VTTAVAGDLYYDPYDVEINANPYPVYRRLREEAPLYYNEPYDFWAVSRYEDVERGLADYSHLISGKGGILEVIRADIEMPPGVLIFSDPPIHTMHRRLLSRVFTPRKMAALEPDIRALCATYLDPLVGGDRFDFVADFSADMPARVICMLLGIPDEEDSLRVRDNADARLRTEAGKPMEVRSRSMAIDDGTLFAEYIDWREKHPSDDIMTQLLQSEFEDETGTVRRLTREEILTYVAVVAGAGSETTTKLIGWAGKVLGDHPDQRRELAENPALVPNAIEELLRFEPPGPHIARFVPEEIEVRGTKIPAGSVMMLIAASANRDDRRFPNGDTFDIHREIGSHVAFGYGIHFCLGANLARLEGRVALEEILKRFPEWEVDLPNAKLAPTSTVRGYETLPTFI